MPLPDPDQVLLLARRIAGAGAADETAISVRSVSEDFVRFADSGPTQVAQRERSEVSLVLRRRAAGGLCEARVTCGSLAEDVTRRALARAVSLLEHTPPNAELLPLGGPVEVRESMLARPTADHSFTEKAQWVDAALAACGEARLIPAGLASTASYSATVVTSAGRAVQGFKSRAALALTASGASGSGYAQATRANVDDLDPAQIITRAVDIARRAQDPAAFAPGRVPVVLGPAAVSSLLLFPAYQGFGAREVEEGTSFLSGRVGERLFSELLTVRDDANSEHYPGWGFDVDGSPRVALPLIDRGRLCAPVTDEYWARKHGVPNSGHATGDLHSPKPQNLVVMPGEHSLEALIAGIDRGLYVNQFHYTNLIDPRELSLTGMTRNGTFMIENGKLGGPVKNLRFTQSLVEALGRVTGVGCDPEVQGALFDGEVVTPALRLDDFNFTSATDF